jgi:hypothetical protein
LRGPRAFTPGGAFRSDRAGPQAQSPLPAGTREAVPASRSSTSAPCLLIGRFLTALTATGLTGVLAVAVAVMLAGGFATIRRLTM